MTLSPKQVTELLIEWREGDEAALDRLMPLVYEELRRMAAHYMRGEREGHTLQASALVNEAYLRLADHRNMQWEGRAHFFGVASQAMRRVLVDHARTRGYQKRGGGQEKIPLEDAAVVAAQPGSDIVALDEALKELARFDERKARIVELRYFGGLSVEETAEVLGVAPITVIRDWNTAKAWLLRELSK
ncbi:MAG: sigma-70 family RNA polymerase sigma factor [Rubrivivax sp.]|nr:sigma-70 family RNA polymerase sigma factor [Pyrinomonadaceae bacterium]